MTAAVGHGRHLAEGALDALRWHWDGAYDFGWDGARCFARRADTGELVSAPTPEALNGAVGRDYCVRPVPRDLPPARGRRRAR
jgi:hypothetical protein